MGALLLLFAAYHVLLGAVRTMVFWVVTPAVGVGALYTWRRFSKSGKKEK